MEKAKTGEWVTAKDADGRIVKGFVEEVDNMDNTAKVYITESERAQDVGKEKWVKQYTVMPLPEFRVYDDEAGVLNIVDYALVIGDRILFNVYADRLRELRGKAKRAFSQ